MTDEKGVYGGMEMDFSKITSRDLTLEPDGQDTITFKEPSLGYMDGKRTVGVQEFSAGSISESMLSDEEKKRVDDFCKQIDIADVRMVNSYGASAQKGIAAFSASITGSVRTKEFGDIGASLRDLRSAIGSTVTPERKGVLGIFQKGKAKVTYFISNYENAETNIRKIEKDLQRHQQTLLKDIYVFDQMYTVNLGFYKELTMYIIAGKKALEVARNTRLVELREKAMQSNDQLDIQLYRDYEDVCKRFEKRIFDLETTRLLSIQTAPQIRLLQNASQEVADKLRADIINTIPLWRNQMVLALGITHTRRALDAQSAVTAMTNEMFQRNAETMKQGSIDAAIASEKAIVDVETLRKVNSDIITAINEVVKIHEEGTRRREEVQGELAMIEEELKQALLAVASRG